MQTSLNLADEPYAARVAAAVLGSFMQQPQDRKTMLRLLTQMLVGEPKVVLQRMVDPRIGVASSEEFFSLAAVKKWLNQNAPEPTWKPLPPLIEEHVSPEERERRVAMLKGAARAIRDAVKAKTVGRPTGLLPIQRDAPVKRMEALSNLQAMQPAANVEAE